MVATEKKGLHVKQYGDFLKETDLFLKIQKEIQKSTLPNVIKTYHNRIGKMRVSLQIC